MVMPLGPDFAKALGIPASELGLVGGSYTAAASVSGIVCSFFLDRYDRRKVLFLAMLGLALGTIVGGFATDLTTLLAARVVAGLFGGPATSVSLSIIADVVAPARRGRAMGAVMGMFSLASIAGVPLALEMARLGGWRIPFFAIGGVALIITATVIALLPPMRGHLTPSPFTGADSPLLRRPEVLQTYFAIFLSMFGSFLMIPNLSAFFQFNLGYPRERLGMLYFVGGSVSFIVMRLAGRLIDRYSGYAAALVSAAVIIVTLCVGYIVSPPLLPAVVIFTGFMVGMSIRGVVVSSLASRVPRPAERARYMSFQSAVQHIACALGAIASTHFLHEAPGSVLIGMPGLAIATAILTAFVPFILGSVERRVRSKEAIQT